MSELKLIILALSYVHAWYAKHVLISDYLLNEIHLNLNEFCRISFISIEWTSYNNKVSKFFIRFLLSFDNCMQICQKFNQSQLHRFCSKEQVPIYKKGPTESEGAQCYQIYMELRWRFEIWVKYFKNEKQWFYHVLCIHIKWIWSKSEQMNTQSL